MNLVVSNSSGALFEIPELRAAEQRQTGGSIHVSADTDVIAMPGSATLVRLPGRRPIGFDPSRKKCVVLRTYNGVEVWAAACVLPAGFMNIANPAYEQQPDAPILPLYAYSALGWSRGRFVCAGMRLDRDRRFDPDRFTPAVVKKEARKRIRQFPGNRIVKHLVTNCVFRYGCPTARSFVMGDKECAVPVSRACNAACLGCISAQECHSGIVASQHRIAFAPGVDEIVQYAAAHLRSSRDPILSFGQGCEGEPLLESELIAEAICAIRKRTRRGIIHMNTNASLPGALERLCRAGLNSIRVTLISASPQSYMRYHRPKGYGYGDVLSSLGVARKHGLWVSLNLLSLPGFTDLPSQFGPLQNLIGKKRPDMLQIRSLNIDPAYFARSMSIENEGEEPMGMVRWLHEIRAGFPALRIGCFNPSAGQIRSHRLSRA